MSAPNAKRTRDDDSSQSTKRQKAANLNSWLDAPLPKRPKLLGVSKPLQDKDSTFIGYAALAESKHTVEKVRQYIMLANENFRPGEPASHVAHGARLLSLRRGKSGLESGDFEVTLVSENDGEDRAGRTITDALASANACDVVIYVSRWFGGSMLGPRRFDDIKQVALEALYNLRDEELIPEVKVELEKLDSEVHNLLKQIARAQGSAAPALTVHDYEGMELAKGEKLKAARNARLRTLNAKLKMLQQEEQYELPDLRGQTKKGGGG